MINVTGKTLAAMGGEPVRTAKLPYGRQWIDDQDIAAVLEVLNSGWLTTGPKVDEFEQAFADLVGAKHAVVVSNGTAALHAAAYALGIGPNDEVIVPSMTFAATANCIVYQGGTPVFADVEPDTLLLDAEEVEERITPNTRAIFAVDYAGQPCDYDALTKIADRHSLALVSDACHALGGSYKNKPVGSLVGLSTFSFHPVKHVTTGEGGAITTDSEELAQRMRVFRNHGITTDHRQRAKDNSWFYEMVDLGYNYRLSDIQCALGISQLTKLNGWVERRRAVARAYDDAFSEMPGIAPLTVRSYASHAYHLYVALLELEQLKCGRSDIFSALHAEGIGVNVHYVPVHLHPYYQQKFGAYEGMCPVSEDAYSRMLSLPIFPEMSEEDVQDVISAVDKVLAYYRS